MQQLDIALIHDFDLNSDGVTETATNDCSRLDLGQDVLQIIDEGLEEDVLLVLSLLFEDLGELRVGAGERSHDDVSAFRFFDSFAHQQREQQVQDVGSSATSVFVFLGLELALRVGSS